MRTLKFLLRKEFLQIFRDKLILRMIFALPVIQLIILPYAATYEIKNITLSVVDHDHSEYSRKLINNFTASGYFQLVDFSIILPFIHLPKPFCLAILDNFSFSSIEKKKSPLSELNR